MKKEGKKKENNKKEKDEDNNEQEKGEMEKVETEEKINGNRRRRRTKLQVHVTDIFYSYFYYNISFWCSRRKNRQLCKTKSSTLFFPPKILLKSL